MINDLITRLRASGVLLWVEDGQIRGRKEDGGKVSRAVRLMAEKLKAAGAEAVAALDEGYTFKDLAPEEALEIGEAIKRGEALLVGKVKISKSTLLHELTIIPIWDKILGG